MRLIVRAFLLTGFVLAIGCAPKKDEPQPKADAPKDTTADVDKAKEVAAAFQKAFKDKELDGAMKHVGTPFLAGGSREKGAVTDKPEAVREYLTERMGRLERQKREVFTEVVDAFPVDQAAAKFPGGDKKDQEAIAQFLGPNGFMVVVGKGKDVGGVVLVRITDGKAGVVGFAQ